MSEEDVTLCAYGDGVFAFWNVCGQWNYLSVAGDGLLGALCSRNESRR